ncbi:excitatory amino acid transporter 1-like isoform X2 [Bolinopsis microptera]
MAGGGKVRRMLVNNLLSILTIAGVIVGVICGYLIRSSKDEEPKHTDELIKGIRIPGDLLLRGLNMLVLPLVMTSLILGLAGNKRGKFNKQAGITILYYVSTTLFAAIIGLVLVCAIQPGGRAEGSKGEELGVRNTTVLDFVGDMIKNLVPANIVAMSHQKTRTTYDHGVMEEPVEGMNMLGVIFISITFGVIIMANKEECQPFLDFCLSLNVIINKLTRVVLWYSPIGIMFLVMAEYSVSDVSEYAKEIGLYVVTVLVGLAIHFFIVLPVILFALAKKNPLLYYKSLLPAMATAFGTASSTVTIPITMKCVKKAGVSEDVVDFVIPVGATINMDGTALYEAVACLFIAQLNDRELTNPEIVITALTATVAAIGAAGIPSAGLVTLVMVLNAVDLGTEHIALILTIDWLLDRFRTMTNVVGDAVGCAVIEQLAGSSCPRSGGAGDEEKFLQLKNKEEDNNHVDHAVHVGA